MKAQDTEPVIFISLQKNEDPNAPMSQKYPRTVIIPTIARIYDNKLNKERIIQYTKGQRTIYLDEMGEPKPAHSKEPIIMVDGLLRLNPKEKTLIEFLEKSFIQGNVDLLDGKPIYYKRNAKKAAQDELEKIYEDVDLITQIKNMSAPELAALSMVMGDVNADRKDASENRWNLTVAAKNTPEKVREKMNNPKTKRKAVLMLAINDNIIDIDNRARVIRWGTGEKISSIPIGLDGLEYMVELSFQEEYQEVWKVINAKLYPHIAENLPVPQSPEVEKSEELEFVERCLNEKILEKKGAWYSVVGAPKGDPYRGFHQGSNQSLVEYFKMNPDIKKHLEEQLSSVTS